MFTLPSIPITTLILLGTAIAISLVWALLPGFLAKSKGRSFWAFFLLGILSPLVLTVVVLCLKDRTAQVEAPAEEAAQDSAEDAETEIAAEDVEFTEVAEESAVIEEAEITDEDAADSETVEAEEDDAQEPAPEAPKPTNKNGKRIVIAVVVSVLAIAAICACCFFAVKPLLHGITGEPIFDPNGAYGQNDVTALANYSVAEATPTDDNMLTVVAIDRDGTPAATNADLQIWYWDEFTNFMQQYGSYASMFGLDYNQPLYAQPSVETGLNWEQMFLKSAINNKSASYALAQAAYANGYTISEEDQKTIDDFTSPEGSLAQAAAEAGHSDVNSYIQLYYGTGITLDTYISYVKERMAQNYQYELMNAEIEGSITDDAISAYYDEHAEEMEASRILKVNNVSVRHILVSPEGEQDAETGEYSEEAWEAAKVKAEELLALWQEDPTEDNFAALATENSADGGSTENGGLYENFGTADMAEEFSDWAFDQSRQTGDTGIVRTPYGYHIMFFVEQTDTKGWVEPTREKLISEQFSQRVDELCVEYPLQFDYMKIRLFDWLTFTINANAETAASEATELPEG